MEKTLPVEVRTDEGWEVHLPQVGPADYVTLCGLDGFDPDVGQYEFRECTRNEAVTCPQCKAIYFGVREMRGVRFKKGL